MLTQANNALLCEVAPGKPMHETIRRYWLPALPSAALAADGDPARVTLLGEDYVLFRDSAGQVGMLNERCCHRGASLCLGRNEEGGLRCIYHGWKFDVRGTIVDMPNATDDSFKRRYRQPAYAVREAANVVWVYLGPQDKTPPFPRFPIFDLPQDQVVAQAYFIDANFVQVMEGLVDSSHVGVLHQDAIHQRMKAAMQDGAQSAVYRQMADDLAPRLEMEDTEFGFHYAAMREMRTDSGHVNVARITAFALPFINFSPNNSTMLAGVPVHDGCTMMFEFNWDWSQPFDAARRERVLEFHGISDAILDRFGISLATYGKQERPRAANRFLQDREAMRRGETFSGLPNFQPEDVAIASSQGPISDRSVESLLPSDQAVVRMRRVLLEAARRVMAGEEPPGLDCATIPRGLQGAVGSDETWQAVLTREDNLRRSFGQFSSELKVPA
ncbi:Rieske 2Fe-2S domain-containing protein [Paraburkholderia sp. J67]|uniref:Rieske 2Fe-2S domain-containing protein n=1 Tax=Paraburkholderia sp. J67 TaxID=2805435 RepID=UPI002ABDE0D3|nr:Rieske 2Fe-2S domain-containing protein [Paraburkholderia sp. J67]